MSVPKNWQGRRWRVYSASVAGSAHVRAGVPRQDSFCFRTGIGDGVIVAAVADGAGSARQAAVGSEVAARSAVQTASMLLRRHVFPIYEGVLREILYHTLLSARHALSEEAKSKRAEPRELATTLIVSILTPEIIGTAQVGDGAVVIAEETPGAQGATPLTLFSPPQRGEYVNETNFVTSRDWRHSLDLRAKRCNVRCLAMFTDGIQSLALDSAHSFRPHVPFFEPLIDWAWKQDDPAAASNGLATFLSSPRVSDRTDDDLTLLIATLS